MKALYPIVGMKHRGTTDVVRKAPERAPLGLEREFDNPHDRNAVKVNLNGVHVAYIRGIEAVRLAGEMDRAGVTVGTAVLVWDRGWPCAEREEP